MDVVRMRARGARWLRSPVAVLGIAALVGGCSGLAAYSSAEDADPGTQAAVPLAARELQDDYVRVVEGVLPSVVQIQGTKPLGSGVVFDDRGDIVTNAHVVGDRKSFQVTTAGSERALSAHLLYAYPDQDLAVVRLDSVPSGLRPATFADSSKVEVGHIVLAMGSPLGLSSSVTQGIVSATGRTVSEERTSGGQGTTLGNVVQTSAPINPGNSGGALVNLDGEVVGIPTLAATDPALGDGPAPGVGFAIPASMVKTVADQVVRTGKVTDSGRAALGITGRTVLGDDYRPAGVAVVEVKRDGAADRVGIRPGDTIVGLGDDPVTTMTALSEGLASDRPGQKVGVTYRRGGSETKVDVTLGAV
ncbi:S1C family serine protease [Streptomyces sp. NPDC002004]